MTDDIPPNTPVIVGVGQHTDHWFGGDPAEAPSPQSLRAIAASAALEDCGSPEELSQAIDRIVVVRTTPDSIPGAPQPFGRCANPPATLATDIGIEPVEGIYSQLGGDQPQTLVSEAARAIHAGDAKTILIAGSEATRALKSALKAGITLDWSRSADGPLTDRGFGDRLLSPYEFGNGLGAPTQTYPAFENALRSKLGLSVDAHRALMSELFAGFSKVAADNPHAQFPTERSAEFLATESAENYPIADPHLKWHVAQETVSQAAAVILTSAGEARRMGIDPAKWVFLHGDAKAKDRCVSERPEIGASLPIELTLEHALRNAGRSVNDIELLDIYSCFPVVVLLACEALGIDWRARPLTVTGGLPFFGGPGNNYSLHAIATMTERLREVPGSFGLVLANGGFMSKESVGIYSTTPRIEPLEDSNEAIEKAIDAQIEVPLLDGPCEGTIESYTVTYKRGEPARGYVLARNNEGRVLARIAKGDTSMLEQLRSSDPIGQNVRIAREDDANIIAAICQK